MEAGGKHDLGSGGTAGVGSPVTLRERADAGVAWSALHIWGTRGLQLGLILVLARLLTPADFGLFAMAQVVLALVHPVAQQGLPEALVQRDRQDEVGWATGLVAVLLGSAAGAILLFLVAPLLAAAFDSPGVAPVLRWLAPGVVLHGFHSVLQARVRSRLAFGGRARAGLWGGVAELAFAVPAAVAGLGVWALVVGFYATLAVESILLLRVARQPLRFRFDRHAYRRLLRFGRHMVAGAFTTFLNRRSDDLFIGAMLGATALGYYTIAYRLLEFATTVFLRAVEQVAFPVFAKLQATPALVADGIRTSFRLTSVVAFPAFAGLAILAHDVIPVLLGPEWAPATPTLRILAIGGFALCALNVLPGAIRAAGRPGWTVLISGGKGLLLAAGFAIAARASVEAVAVVFTGGLYLVFPAFFTAARRLFPLSLPGYLAEARGPMAATATMVAGLMAAAPLLVDLEQGLRLALSVGGGVLLYFVALLIFGRSAAAELYHRAHGLVRRAAGPAPSPRRSAAESDS